MKYLSARLLGLTIIWAVLYWVSVALAMHVLEPEFSPIKTPMSAYVLGTYGSWMTSTFFVWSAVLLAAAYGLVGTLERTRLTRAAWCLFVIATTGVVLAGIFQMDFPPPIRTLSGRLHAIGGSLAFPAMTVGARLFSLSFRRNERWRTVSALALGLSSCLMAVLALGILSLLVLGFAGYAQRLHFAILLAWMIRVGVHLTRVPP